LFLWDRLACGLGWVLGPNFHSGICWVGLGRSFGGLGWVEQIGPTDNSVIDCPDFLLETRKVTLVSDSKPLTDVEGRHFRSQ